MILKVAKSNFGPRINISSLLTLPPFGIFTAIRPFFLFKQWQRNVRSFYEVTGV